MQWFIFRIFILLSLIDLLLSLSKSVCSPFLFVETIDIGTNNEYVTPCPVSNPCQCLCAMESKRLWIDCFYRQLKDLPIFETIPSNKTIIRWNIDLAFNLFENLPERSSINWLPANMKIERLIFSNSLAYDLIVHLNLTHRQLFDRWSSDDHLIGWKEEENKRRLNDLTFELREKSVSIKNFHLSLSNPSIVYLDHHLLRSIPIESFYNATNLYEIYLSYNQITHLPPFAFGFSHRLTRLDLSHNQISSIDQFTFHRHPDAFAGPFLIDYLDLSYNQLTSLDEKIFSYLVNLRLLKLQFNQIHSLSAHLWTGLYRLKYLDLSHNQIENISQAFYSGYLHELSQLKLSANNLTQMSSCEFLSMKSLTKLDLSGNQLSRLDTCSFYGLGRSSFRIYLHSNQLEFLPPCSFHQFSRSSIYVENNPLICNCSFNYLLQDRQSIVYTGQECRAGFAYEPQTHLIQPAVHKSKKYRGKKFRNNSNSLCRQTFKFYRSVCSKVDCVSQCAAKERFVIQITTIATPSRSETLFEQNLLNLLFFVLMKIHERWIN